MMRSEYLANTTDIVKAEVIYEDSVLEQVVVNNFEKIYFLFEATTVDVNKITIKV